MSKFDQLGEGASGKCRAFLCVRPVSMSRKPYLKRVSRLACGHKSFALDALEVHDLGKVRDFFTEAHQQALDGKTEIHLSRTDAPIEIHAFLDPKFSLFLMGSELWLGIRRYPIGKYLGVDNLRQLSEALDQAMKQLEEKYGQTR